MLFELAAEVLALQVSNLLWQEPLSRQREELSALSSKLETVMWIC